MIILVILTDVPDSPSKPEVADVSHTSITLSWTKPLFDGGIFITSYMVEMMDIAEQTWLTVATELQTPTYTAVDLTPGTEHLFRVIAINDEGMSKPSQTSVIITLGKDEKYQPRQVEERVDQPSLKAELLTQEEAHAEIEQPAEVTVEVMQSEQSMDIDLETTTQKEAVSIEIIQEGVVSVEGLPSEDKASVVIRSLPTQPQTTEETLDGLVPLPEEELETAATLRIAPVKELEAEELEMYEDSRQTLKRKPGTEAVTVEVGKTPSVIRVDSVERAPLPVRDRLESYPEEELSEASVVKLLPEKEHEVEELPEELVDKTAAQKIKDAPVDKATKKAVTTREAPEEVSLVQPRKPLESMTEEELKEAVSIQLAAEDVFEAEEIAGKQPEKLRPQKSIEEEVVLDQVDTVKTSVIRGPADMAIAPALPSIDRLGLVTEEELVEATTKEYIPEDVEEAAELPEEVIVDVSAEEIPEVSVTVGKVSKEKPTTIEAIRQETELTIAPGPGIDVVYERTEYLDKVEEEDFKEASTHKLKPEREGEAEEFVVGEIPKSKPEEVPGEDLPLDRVSKQKPLPVRDAPEEVQIAKTRPKLDSYEEEEFQEASVVTVAPEVIEEYEVLTTEETEEYSPEKATAVVDRASTKEVPLRDAPEEVKIQRIKARMESFDEEDLKEAVSISVAPHREEEVEDLTELQRYEEVTSEKVPSVDVSEEVSKKPTFVREAPEQVQTRRLLAKMDSVEEEELREAVSVRVAPRREKDVDVWTEEISQEEIAPTEEDATDTVYQKKSVVISHPYEPEPEYTQTRSMLDVLPEEQLETALTARLVPRDEFKADTLATEEVSPLEATSKKTPVEVTLGVEGKPLVRSVPGKEKGPELLEEMEGIVVEGLEEQTAVQVVIEKEETVVERPVAPVIVDKITNKNVKTGKPVKFTCTVTGTPKPKIQWFHDKELLESSVRFVQTFEEDVATLEIQQPKTRDTGEYKCVVINTAGEDICTAKLSVTEVKRAPTFVQKPEVAETPETTDAVFKCKVDGFPKPTITWNKGWKQVKTGGRFTVSYDEETEESVLTIKDTTQADAGKYTCFLKSPLGEGNAAVSLKIAPKPKEKPKEEVAEQATVEKLEEVEVLAEVTEPEEARPEVVPVEGPQETIPEKKPSVKEAPEEVTKVLKPQVSLEAVSEEQLEKAALAKVVPETEEQIEVLIETTKPEEVEVVTVEGVLEEVIPEKKPAVIAAPEEQVTLEVKTQVAMEAVTEEQLEIATMAMVTPRKEEEVDILAEIEIPEEVTPAVVSVEEAPEEVLPKKKPTLITMDVEEAVAKTPKAQVALEAVTEEKLETAVTAKFKPRTEEHVEVLAEFKKPAEIAEMPIEEAPQETIPEKKPSVISAEEIVTIAPAAQEVLESLPEEQLEVAVTKIAPQPEDEADVLLVGEKIIPVEAKPEQGPTEVVLEVSEQKAVTIRGIPEKDIVTTVMEEMQQIPEEQIERLTAAKVVLEVEETVEEIPLAPVFTAIIKNKSVKEGKPVTFTCSVTGTPKPEVKWFR